MYLFIVLEDLNYFLPVLNCTISFLTQNRASNEGHEFNVKKYSKLRFKFFRSLLGRARAGCK